MAEHKVGQQQPVDMILLQQLASYLDTPIFAFATRSHDRSACDRRRPGALAPWRVASAGLAPGCLPGPRGIHAPPMPEGSRSQECLNSGAGCLAPAYDVATRARGRRACRVAADGLERR
jgi:hypothetical protein